LRGSDVSVLHDLMIHDLDLLLALDSSPVKLKSARAGMMVTKTYDWCSAVFEFESGLQAIVNSSRLAKEMTRAIRAVDKSHVWVANLQSGENLQTKIVENAQDPIGFDVKSVGRGDNLMTETENFILAVRGEDNIAVTGVDGLNALTLVDEIIKEIQSPGRG
jgi:predicted dehydrogenase